MILDMAAGEDVLEECWREGGAHGRLLHRHKLVRPLGENTWAVSHEVQHMLTCDLTNALQRIYTRGIKAYDEIFYVNIHCSFSYNQ